MKSFKTFYTETRFLSETPLPDTWDDALFNERVPFAKRVRYAVERAQKVGTGSSRTAFVIPFEGRQTVLKVAKNEKGMAQNEAEAQMLGDWYAKSTGMLIPMIDYDEKSDRPTWIHTEFATKAKESDFVRACGGKLADLMSYTAHATGKNGWFGGDDTKIDPENEFAQGMVDICGNYDLPLADFNRLANWGVYDGAPVIIDIGLNHEVQKKHYSGKPRSYRGY